MAIRMPGDMLINSQTLEAAVNGPDEANRLFVFTGAVLAQLRIGPSQNARETFTFLIGPKLTRRQFISAVADASISSWAVTVDGAAARTEFLLEMAEADWDDESQQVEVRVEMGVLTRPNAYGDIGRFNYHVTVLAQI